MKNNHECFPSDHMGTNYQSHEDGVIANPELKYKSNNTPSSIPLHIKKSGEKIK